MEEHPSTCLNCSTPLRGKFCFHCGQKVIEPKERTVLHFIYQFFGSAFFLENNFFKNLWTLLSKPGKLPLDFIEGRRKRWMPPFSLFLLINLFYFWFSPLTDLNLKLKDQLNQPHHKRWANYIVDRKLEKNQLSLEDYAEKYNTKSTNYANSLVILHVPVFAVFISILYWRKRYFYADHFIYALYFCAFILLGALLQIALLYILFYTLRFLNVEFETSTLLNVTKIFFWIYILLYTFFSLRKTYYQRYWQVAVALIPFLFFFLVTHFLYRTVLFLIIYSVT